VIRPVSFTAAALVATMMTAPPTRADEKQDSLEYPVKASLLLNFAKFTEWPAGSAQAVSGAVAICVFFGGWRGPFLPPVLWFLIKLALFLFFYIWLRATFPRLRYDQLMAFGWKVLLPASLLNLAVTGVVLVLRA